jgi:enamine deaminase RidA (YjgF/YER057c/UK114 family)
LRKIDYVHTTRAGNLLFLAGKGIGTVTGKVGRGVSLEDAYAFARSTAIMLLSVLHRELGDLSQVRRVLKVTGFVNAVPEFTDHPKVLNGCSDLLVDVLGDRGRHARTAIGVGSTPSQIPLEVEAIIEAQP